jgi:hypothetical protein
MAGSFADFLENKILDHVFSGTVYTPPATLYIALSSALYNDSGLASELASTGAYARAAVTNSAVNFPASVGGAKSNGTTITFPTASGNWVEAVSFYIMDAATLGNTLGGGDLTVAKTALSGDTVSFAVGNLDITLA